MKADTRPETHEMPTAVALLVLSSALMTAFLAAGLPITVKKGEALPMVDDRDMLVVPAAGHVVGRGEAHLVTSKTELQQQQQANKVAEPPAAASNSSSAAAPASKGNKKSDDVGATTEFSPMGPSGPTKVNSGALLRSFYVFMGLGFIVIMYLVARSVR